LRFGGWGFSKPIQKKNDLVVVEKEKMEKEDITGSNFHISNKINKLILLIKKIEL